MRAEAARHDTLWRRREGSARGGRQHSVAASRVTTRLGCEECHDGALGLSPQVVVRRSEKKERQARLVQVGHLPDGVGAACAARRHTGGGKERCRA